MTTTGMDAFEVSEEDVPGDGPEGEDEKWGALRIIGLVALVAAFSGFVYLAYMQGVRNGSAGAPPVITAEAGPYKEQPADPGGKTFANADKLIFDRVEGKLPGVGGAKSAPVSEKPAEFPADKEQSRVVDTSSEALVVADTAAAPVKPQQRPSGITTSTQRPNAQGGPVSSATVQSPVKVADAAQPDPSLAHAAKPEPKAEGDIGSKIASIEAAKPSPTLSAGSSAHGAYVIQIASYRDRPSAEGAYAKLIEKHSDLVSSLSPDYQSAQVAGKGTYFRLRIGPFDSQADASAVCKALKARGQDCLVVKS